ncbi:MAG: hypothetical protein ABI396_05685 [Ktedonobacteraceae bacterium]
MSDENDFSPPERVSPTDPTVPNLPPAVSPTDVTEANVPVPIWSPPQQTFRRHRTFPISRTILLAALAILLIGGGLGFTIFATTTQYRASLHRQATTVAHQTNVTTLTHATATANAFSTANAKIYATATAQVGVTATVITQSTDASATATTLGSIFTQATSGTPTLTDPLSDNTGNNNWDETSGTVDGSCVFTGGDYHVTEARQGYLQPCIAESTNFSNFAYQVQMIFDKGDQAGIIFRATGSKGAFYFFRIGIDGSYALDLYKSANQTTTLSNGFSSAITTGLTQANQLAVIAVKGQLLLYANQQYITSIVDNTLTSGTIGVAVQDAANPTEVEFSNVQVWNVSTLSLTPTP